MAFDCRIQIKDRSLSRIYKSALFEPLFMWSGKKLINCFENPNQILHDILFLIEIYCRLLMTQNYSTLSITTSASTFVPELIFSTLLIENEAFH